MYLSLETPPSLADMEFSEVVRRRRMVRSYQSGRPVERTLITHLLELAIRAPSAGFSQGWHFLVLDSPYEISQFWDATASAVVGSEGAAPPDRWLVGMRSAPALILALSDKQAYLDRYAEPDKGWVDRSESRWPAPYWDIDTGMASLLVLLGATDRGLSSCWFGVPPEAAGAIRATFGIPQRLGFVGVISLGYGAPDRRSPSLKRGRRPVGEVVSWGRMTPASTERDEADPS